MMGPEAMGVQPINVDWWDPKVCKNFICGTCPHDIFGNTVSGPWGFPLGNLASKHEVLTFIPFTPTTTSDFRLWLG